MKIVIKSYDSYKYASVWKVTERKDGQIYKTKDTGLSILKCEESKLHKDYVTSSYSTKLTSKGEFEIDVVTVGYFK